jgi:NodT family efflux transporter outer membrane factor (OMF) lipoprotein
MFNQLGSDQKPSSALSVLTLCMAVTLTACASNQLQDDAAINDKLAGNTMFTPQSWANAVDKTQRENAQQVDWLSSFQDSLLSDLVKQALANNRDLMAASANVERANAMAVQAGAQLKPQANLSFAGSRTGSGNDLVPKVTGQTIAVQLNWELDLWGRISAGQQAAIASADAAAADYKYAQHSLAAATSKAYFVAIEAGEQASILQDILASLEETFRIVNLQHENGLASGQDVALTKSDLASSREQLITLKASQREALRALEVLLGQYPDGDLLIRTALPALPAMPPVGVPSDVLERRPDIIASERRVAAAFNSVKQAKAARLPQLGLTGNLGGSSSSLSDITDPANVSWQLASNLLAPILDGGARKAQVKIANAEQKQALASYAQTALTAFNEVEGNLDLANTLVQRKQELDLSLSEAEKAYRIAQLRHKEGEIALIDLLTVQQRVLSAKSNLSSIQRLALEQRINLFLALGGDWNN